MDTDVSKAMQKIARQKTMTKSGTSTRGNEEQACREDARLHGRVVEADKKKKKVIRPGDAKKQ